MSPPRTIGQYQIGERLGTGAAGEVYKGIDTKVGREVAIKFLRPELASDPSWVGRFLAEAKSLGRLNHPNIATLYALDQKEDHVCMIMELVRGRTVEQILEERHGGLGTRESLAIFVQVADGLSYAHETGVIHRDIKPSNLMVTESGRVKIMDFGIARVRGSERLTRAGEAIGTLLYMSPEQWRGLEGDERSDIYSLAIVLYELLAGKLPFKGTSQVELMKAHCYTPPPPLIPRVAGVEPPLESAIMTALSKRSEQRFPSMRSFSDATGATALRGDATGIVHSCIRPAQGQGVPHETTKRAPFYTIALAVARSRAATIARRFRGLHPAVQGVSVGVLVMAIVGAGLYLFFRPEPSPAPPDTPSVPPRSDDAQSGQPAIPPPGNGQVKPQSNSVDTESAPNRTFRDNFFDKSPPFDSTQEPQIQPAEKPASRPQGSNTQEGDKFTFAAFQMAYDRANYKDALIIAKRLEAVGDPAGAGAYGEGLIYLRGNDVEKDFEKANGLFYEAAGKGFTMAMVKLGTMYYKGLIGEGHHISLAYKWYKQAADKGDGEASGEALFSLGGMCRDGDLKNHELKGCNAKDLFRQAAEAGYRKAKQKLEELGVRE